MSYKLCPYCRSPLKEGSYSFNCETCSQVIDGAEGQDSAGTPQRPTGSRTGYVHESEAGWPVLPGQPAGPAWEGKGTLPYRLVMTVKQMLFSPKPTMAASAQNGLGRPIFFALLMTLLAMVLDLVWSFVLGGEDAQSMQAVFNPLDSRQTFLGIALFVFIILLILGAGILLAALMACFYHLGLIIVGGARQGYQATFRSMLYAYAVAVWYLVPVLGVYIFAVWGTVTASLALAGAHGIGGGRGFAAIVLGVLMVLLVALLIYVPVFFILTTAGQRF